MTPIDPNATALCNMFTTLTCTTKTCGTDIPEATKILKKSKPSPSESNSSVMMIEDETAHTDSQATSNQQQLTCSETCLATSTTNQKTIDVIKTALSNNSCSCNSLYAYYNDKKITTCDESLCKALSYAHQWSQPDLFLEAFSQLLSRLRNEAKECVQNKSPMLKGARNELFAILGLNDLIGEDLPSGMQTSSSHPFLKAAAESPSLGLEAAYGPMALCEAIFSANAQQQNHFFELLHFLGISIEEGIFADIDPRKGTALSLFAAQQCKIQPTVASLHEKIKNLVISTSNRGQFDEMKVSNESDYKQSSDSMQIATDTTSSNQKEKSLSYRVYSWLLTLVRLYAHPKELVQKMKTNLSQTSLDTLDLFLQKKAIFIPDETFIDLLDFSYDWNAPNLFNEIFSQLTNRLWMNCFVPNQVLKKAKEKLFSILGLQNITKKNQDELNMSTLSASFNKTADELIASQNFNDLLCPQDCESLSKFYDTSFNLDKNAKRKFLELLCFLGQSIEKQIFTDIPPQKAFALYLFAGRAGTGYAYWLIGSRYEMGNCPFIKMNPEIARQWYRKAAELGCGQAAVELGHYYEQEPSNSESALFAQFWYSEAAKYGFWYAQKSINQQNHKRKH